ncbi:MAG: hypothetical protein K8963_05585 [Proteobacteria bacterium]|nr:hypothetical protein [Pseudomonadota bacterium]
MQQNQKILSLDYGSPYTPIIARQEIKPIKPVKADQPAKPAKGHQTG